MSESSRFPSPLRARLELGGIFLLLGAWGAGLYRLAGPPDLTRLPPWPGWRQLELLARSLSAPVDGLVQLTVLGLWLLLALLVVWLCATLLLEMFVLVVERGPARGAAWVRQLQALTRDLAFPLVRPALATLFAVQLVARSPTTGMADGLTSPPIVELSPASAVANVGPVDDDQAAGVEDEASAPAPEVVVHTVQKGETTWAIAKRYYGTGEEYTRVIAANVGRPMGRGEVFTAAGQIKEGWLLNIELPASNIEERDGRRFYVVQRYDTLQGIAARTLGSEERYVELFALNVGVARLDDDGPLLTDPDLIWPELRLDLPGDTVTQAVAPAPAADEPAVSEPEPVAPVVTPPPEVGVPKTPIPSFTVTSVPTNGTCAVNTNGVAAAATPETVSPVPSPPPPESIVHPEPDEPALARWPEMSAADIAVGVAGAAVLSAAVLGALRARRRRVSHPQPESDTLIDFDNFTVAEPAAVRAARRSNGDDPHGIALGEQLAQTLLQRAAWAEIDDVEVVSVAVGRSDATVTFAAPLARRARLETTLRATADLAASAAVSRSPDQDVVLALAGVRQERLGGTSTADAPLLLCLGLRPDSRALLVGWHALGHLLVATRPGTAYAQDHLAALVATLAGQSAPSALHLFTLAGADSALGQLAPLPHQQRVVDPADRAVACEVLAGLRAEVERRQYESVADHEPELVLVVDELAKVAAEDDLPFLLTYGEGCRVRVLAATADSATALGPLVETFGSRSVLRLDDEAGSVRLLGSSAALALVDDGRMLTRLGGRAPLVVLGLHLTDTGRQRLFEDLGMADGPPAGTPPSASPPTADKAPPAEPSRPEPAVVAPAALADDSGDATAGDAPPVDHTPLEPADVPVAPDTEAEAEPPVARPQPGEPAAREPGGNHVVAEEPPVGPARRPTVIAAACPERLLPILRRAPLALDCGADAAIWTAQGRLPLEQGTFLELLARLGAGPLLSQQLLLADRAEDRWPGVALDEVLDEVWAPWARNPGSREGGQAWVRMRLSPNRLPTAVSQLPAVLQHGLVSEREGYLRLNNTVIVSDVEAFMLAVERARVTRGAEQVAAAEEALSLRVPGLLPDTPRMYRLPGGRRQALYGWLDEPRWERGAARLAALWRDVARLLARAYRGVGRAEAALAVAAELLGEDPLDRAAHEELLLAAAQTGDQLQLGQAWQQVQAFSDGDLHSDVRALYARLVREHARPATPH